MAARKAASVLPEPVGAKTSGALALRDRRPAEPLRLRGRGEGLGEPLADRGREGQIPSGGLTRAIIEEGGDATDPRAGPACRPRASTREDPREARSREASACLLVSASLALSGAVLLAPEAPAATAVPTPESVLGFVPGEDRKLADWEQVLALPQGARRRLRAGERRGGRPDHRGPAVRDGDGHLGGEPRAARGDPPGERAPRRPARPRRRRGRAARPRTARRSWRMAYSIHSTEVGGTLAVAAPPPPPRVERRRPRAARCSTRRCCS